jgi:hypothetical protein
MKYAVPPMDFLPFLPQYEFSMKYVSKLLKIWIKVSYFTSLGQTIISKLG